MECRRDGFDGHIAGRGRTAQFAILISLASKRSPCCNSTTVTERTRFRPAGRQPACSGAGWLADCVCVVVLSALTLKGAEGVPAGSSPTNITTATFEYQETGYTLRSWRIPFLPQSTPFAKEPVATGGKIIRGVLELDGTASNSIPFIWNRAAGQLFLDLNRNRDLTDDPEGIFLTREPAGAYYQDFTNVHLSFSTPSGNRRMLADLSFYDYGYRSSYCSAALRSFWQGQVTLHGQSWQVGCVENLLGRPPSVESRQLLMRPWEERDKPFDLNPDSVDAFSFSRKLFAGGHAYQLDWINETERGNSKLNLQFTEQQPALGELKITGGFIQRLMLQDGPYLVVLDHPQSVVQVPIGHYRGLRIRLKQGEAEAWWDSDARQPGISIAVDEKKPVLLAVGGPLTNSVSVTRRGKYLDLNYQLIGVGGGAYKLARQDSSHPPEVAIYKGGKKIASGKFQYG